MGQEPFIENQLPLAAGRTAEVYAWGEDQVLKLYRPGFAPSEVEQEAWIGAAVAAAGVHVPAVGEVLTVTGRCGIVFGRVDGIPMLQQLLQRPWTYASLAQCLGHLHAHMHLVACPQLPSRHSYLQRSIEHAAELSPALRQAVLARLSLLADGDSICHGDYHPDNVLMARSGPVVIDWMTAGHGNPDADVARTVLLLRMGEPPAARAVQRSLLAFARRLFLNSYLHSYRCVRPCPQNAIDDWLPVIAAARLREGIVGERKRLLAMAQQALLLSPLQKRQK